MSFFEQIWGTTNERIHTLGATALLLSLILFLCFTPLSKLDGLVVFYLFGCGCSLIGIATTRNAWSRWKTGEDTLILLRKRGQEGREHAVVLHLFGRSYQWTGRIAHVDVGAFSIAPIDASTAEPTGSSLSRGYQMFRAVYWSVCSSIPFQALFGLAILGYGFWLLHYVFRYMTSNA